TYASTGAAITISSGGPIVRRRTASHRRPLIVSAPSAGNDSPTPNGISVLPLDRSRRATRDPGTSGRSESGGTMAESSIVATTWPAFAPPGPRTGSRMATDGDPEATLAAAALAAGPDPAGPGLAGRCAERSAPDHRRASPASRYSTLRMKGRTLA